MGGATIRVAKNMTGLDTDPFLARPAFSHERLDPSSPGIMAAGSTSFTWQPLPDAVVYTFTIFDQHDNVVWSVRSTNTTESMPSDIPPLASRRPYVWKLSGFGDSGKPVPQTRWGIITLLSSDDQAQLTTDANALKAQIAANPQDTTPLTLLAELYAEYGVYEASLSTLEDTRLSNQPGIGFTISDHYAKVSHLAVMLAAQAASAPPAM
jgi:hypothetical protein